MFDALVDHGVVGRAIRKNLLSLQVHDLREFSKDRHRSVDDRPYGGGPGMVMMAEPMIAAIRAAKSAVKGESKVIYLSPQGRRFDHTAAKSLAAEKSLVLVSGRYEGVDERVLEHHIDEEWSIGDYVLSGGELPAMVVIDAVARLLPNSLGNSESAEQDSFVDGLLDCPHYTRPEEFEGLMVPNVLLGGDHQAIDNWRLKQSLGRTWLRRPELLEKLELSELQRKLLAEFIEENSNGASSE